MSLSKSVVDGLLKTKGNSVLQFRSVTLRRVCARLAFGQGAAWAYVTLVKLAALNDSTELASSLLLVLSVVTPVQVSVESLFRNQSESTCTTTNAAVSGWGTSAALGQHMDDGAHQSLSFTKPNSKLETEQPEPVPTSVDTNAADVKQTLLYELCGFFKGRTQGTEC